MNVNMTVVTLTKNEMVALIALVDSWLENDGGKLEQERPDLHGYLKNGRNKMHRLFMKNGSIVSVV